MRVRSARAESRWPNLRISAFGSFVARAAERRSEVMGGLPGLLAPASRTTCPSTRFSVPFGLEPFLLRREFGGDDMNSERRSKSPATIERSERPDTAITTAEPAPRMSAVYRRGDTVCHARCGRPLALQGVRGLIEADFYCYTCLTHVTIPIAVLDDVPVEPVDTFAVGTVH